MKVLFVCNAGINRSRTGADLWKKRFPKDEVKYIGTINLEKPDLLHWADKIVCFEKRVKKLVLEKVFDDNKIWQKIEVWEIPDIYNYMDPELVRIIGGKISEKRKKSLLMLIISELVVCRVTF